MKHTRSKGFTLIELLVVLAIISLLSSVILATVQDARNKAKATAFRSEIEQFIKAIELYKLSTGNYPSGGYPETVPFYYVNRPSGIDGGLVLVPKLTPQYIVSMPKYPLTDGFTAGTWGWAYGVNQLGNNTPNTSYYFARCGDLSKIKPYVIIVSKTNPYIDKSFSDWEKSKNSNGAENGMRCFGLD